jgi:hypothetical protein
LAACEYPSARLTYAISDDPATSCGTTSCRDIKLPCEAVISIRIVDPDDPTSPLYSTCEVLPPNRDMDLCAISTIELGDKPLSLPAKTLEFQMVVWPLSEVQTEVEGVLDCAKHEVKFDAVYGFPVSQDPAPAIGGHTFYHPGDDEIRVELGCSNLESLETCNPSREVEFRTSVRSFDNIDLFIARTQGMQLEVKVGEPKLRGADIAYSLQNEDLTPMALDDASPFAAGWIATFAPDFIDIACVQVLQPAAMSTATVKCTSDNIPTELASLNLPDAVLVPRETLSQLLFALFGMNLFPTDGLTLGLVVDKDYIPVKGAVVTTSSGSVRYLNDARSAFDAAATGTSGIFVSLDAEFGTKFRVPTSLEEIGGRIQERVTIVVVQKQ